jgi:hypothetical protein
MCDQCTNVCEDKHSTMLRVNGLVRKSASLRTMEMAAGCSQQRKDPKLASYDRVYMRRRACATGKV